MRCPMLPARVTSLRFLPSHQTEPLKHSEVDESEWEVILKSPLTPRLREAVDDTSQLSAASVRLAVNRQHLPFPTPLTSVRKLIQRAWNQNSLRRTRA